MEVNGVYGQDCPMNTVIEKEQGCIMAASRLQMEFRENVRSELRPAGCYVKNSLVYFNTITDPYMTSPSNDTVAICRGTAI